jgi:hypothetical protein
VSLEAFAVDGSFYKGNIHTHSDRSDGALSPQEVCDRYRRKGYDFLCLSDHFLEKYRYHITDTTGCRTPGFTTILGAELHAPAINGGQDWHILTVGLPLDFAPRAPGETGPEMADRAAAAGAFVVIAHPEWYGLTLEDAQKITCAHAVEVYNHTSQVTCSRGGGGYFLDAMLMAGRRINALAVDDAHFKLPGDDERDAFGGWVMVKAQANEPGALLAALKAGHYYSTQAPDILDMAIEGAELVVRTSPANQLILAGRNSLTVNHSGLEITGARLPLSSFKGKWGRLMVLDAEGRCAWSNPMWF